MRYEISKIVNQKFKKVWLWFLSEFFDHIFAYYDSLLPIGSYEIIKRLQMWLNNPQCGHTKGQKFPVFWWDNHQGKSSHIYLSHYSTQFYSFFSATCVRSMTAWLPAWRCLCSLCVGRWWVGNGAVLALIMFPSLSKGSSVQLTLCYVMLHFCGLTIKNVDYIPFLV